jgi:hypothetical protein
MKKTIATITTLLFTGIILAGSAVPMDKQHSRSGKLFHTSTIEGFTFNYHLINMTDITKNKSMPGMGRKTGTHHLMLTITGPIDLSNAMVGLLITAPDGNNSKAMTVGMGNGFGADVNMMKKGVYKIKAKLVLGDIKLVDEFTYKLK